ncbi:MAG: hypothetical protein K1X78_21025 [Verrucomicrobiaceae bacterium]|nr:hypothetical protein [Verrucomicrobiaceae bacterium]
MSPSHRHNRGYTSAELLLVLALGAIVIGGTVVAFGSLAKNLPRVSAVVEVDLGSKLNTYYGAGASSTTKQTVNSAPNQGAVGLAERLREQFNTDVISATAVYCLARDSATANTYHPTSIPYNPSTDQVLDTSQKFRDHLSSKGVSATTLYGSERNFSSSKSAATIFILGYSKTANELNVISTYDIDVVKVTKPDGFYASVRRYVGAPVVNVNEPQGYEVFYPPYDYNSTTWANASGTTDGFTPIFVAFERSVRASLSEGSTTDRFKKAAERPFYFIWWPDPGAGDLRKQPNSYPTTDPRQAYNHQGGRTSFMFTVPMFPSL